MTEGITRQEAARELATLDAGSLNLLLTIARRAVQLERQERTAFLRECSETMDAALEAEDRRGPAVWLAPVLARWHEVTP